MACFRPLTIKSPYNEKAYIEVPCGKCSGCRRDKQNQWFIRFVEENKKNSCKFVTLTYDDEKIPKSIDEDGCIHYNVDKTDLQKFFKRMRKNNKFKYFAVSEYGSVTQRPHYHLLIFSNKNIDIDKYWRYGFVCSLPANKGSFRYVTKYLLKGSNVPEGSTENFMLCSKRPAIGIDKMKDIDIDLLENPIVRDNNIIYPLPRYYRKKLYEQFNDNGETFKHELIETMESRLKNSPMYKKFLENHKPDEDFFQWLKYLENKHNRKQKIIKNGKEE